MNTQQFLAITIVLLMSMPIPVWSAAAAIGTAAGRGNFELNEKTVAGTGTLRAGDRIATAANGSTLRLSGGARVDLSPRSTASVFGDRLVLGAGAALVRAPGSDAKAFGVEAGRLSIVPESPSAEATVSYVDGKRVQVSAAGGSYQVKNAHGVLVARVLPGHALVFAPQAGVNSRMVLNGVIENVRGRYFLTDQAAAVKFQLSGAGLDRYTGKRVAVTGNLMEGVAGVDGAAHVVSVQLVELAMQVKKAKDDDDDSKAGAVVGGAGAGAGAAGAGAGAGAGAAGAAAGGGLAGLGTGVVAGVGVAAAAGTGLAIHQVVTNDDNNMSK